jgi:hypothetical protein
MEHEEYTAENYPSFGKKYADEKAIISLTSWKARINTVSKTLYSLIKQCPGFHIVLVLSEEEFPKMMDELPDNLKLFVDNELIEVLWVYKNYKSFKKVLFTMDKYRDVPVISADDDCIYTCNYAQTLYNKWIKNKNKIIRYTCNNSTDWYFAVAGQGTLFTWNNFGKFAYKALKFLNENDIKKSLDDNYYNEVIFVYKLKFMGLNRGKFFVSANEIKPLHPNAWWKNGGKSPARKFHYLKKIMEYKKLNIK